MPKTPAKAIAEAFDFGLKNIRAVGRSLQKATANFQDARQRAEDSGDHAEEEEATARRLRFDREVETAAAFTRAAAKQSCDVTRLNEFLEDAETAIRDDEGRQTVFAPSAALGGEATSTTTSAEVHAEDDDERETLNETLTSEDAGSEAPDEDGPGYERESILKEGSMDGSFRSRSPDQILADHARREASINREEKEMNIQAEMENLRHEVERQEDERKSRDAALRREMARKEVALKARLKMVEQERKIAHKRADNDSEKDEAMSRTSGSVKSSLTTRTTASQRPSRTKGTEKVPTQAPTIVDTRQTTEKKKAKPDQKTDV